MLDCDLVLEAVVAALRSIPALVLEMGKSAENITGHRYAYGEENSLARAISEMTSPSILVAYRVMQGGNFSGSVMWKHHLEAYFRPNNAGSTGPSAVTALSAPNLWRLMMRGPILGTTLNIRQISLMSGNLIMLDIPSLIPRQDENGADFFCAAMVFSEFGDA